MTRTTKESVSACALEPDVLEAISVGRQDKALNDHVAQCATCAEMAGIACALRDDLTASCREARVPAAGTVWWRATIRARAEAARAAAQPISVLQGFSGACAVGVLCALVTVAWRSVPSFERFSDVVTELETGRAHASLVSALVITHALPLVLAGAACLVVAPLALYFTLTDE
jgi:hypothetical protein